MMNKSSLLFKKKKDGEYDQFWLNADKAAIELEKFRVVVDLINLRKKDIDELEKNPEIVKFVMDSVFHSNAFSKIVDTMMNTQDATGMMTRAIMAHYKKGDPAAEELITRVRDANYDYFSELLKSNPEWEDKCTAILWFTRVCWTVGISKERYELLKEDTEVVLMICDIVRKTASKHGFLESDEEEGNSKPKPTAEEFSNHLYYAVIIHVMDSNEIAELIFSDHYIESHRERIEWMDDGEEKDNDICVLKKYEAILDEKDPFVIYDKVKMRSTKKKVIESGKDFVTGNKESLEEVADSKNRSSDTVKREWEDYQKFLLDKPRLKLTVFRQISDSIHLTKKDIDEMAKNPEIVKIVFESLSTLISSTNCTVSWRELCKDETTSDALMQTIWDNCKSRKDAAAKELIARSRRANHEYCKKLFLSINPGMEAEWKKLVWFKAVCKIVGISDERYKKMKKNLKMMKMISDIARETALKHGFSEIYNEKGNREPKLDDEEFCNELCLSVQNHVMKSNDPLEIEFRDHFVESKKEWIASMEDCERRRCEIISLESIEDFLERKDPTVVYNGQKMRSSKVNQMNVGEEAEDINKDFEDRVKDLKSLEEGCDKESEGEEENPSFLSSMLGLLGF